jgi:hypothetical protein
MAQGVCPISKGLTLVTLSAACMGFAGCTARVGDAPAAITRNITLQGNVHGGQQPVVGATIQLYEADLTSYTGTSKPLIASTVLSGTDGSFSITGTYTCDPGALVYLTATGGDPGAGINTASAMMTALGPCSALNATTFIYVSEVTTVASVYALSGFMSSPASVSANATYGTNNGTSAAKLGITNAFAAVNNLVDTSTGVAHSSTPSGNGTIPLAKINSLANILASCVNSTGPASTTCSTLFSNAKSFSGATPSDTIQAMLNISHNPGANVANLFALIPAAAPFVPNLGSTVPNDLTLAINYHGGGPGGINSLAADIRGNVWAVYCNCDLNGTNPSSVVELSPLGEVEATYTGAATGLYGSRSLAIDPDNNVWVANCGTNCGNSSGTANNSLTKIGIGGFPITNYAQNDGINIGGNSLAINGTGDVYAINYGASLISKYSNAGVPTGAPFPISNFSPLSISLDGPGNLYVPGIGPGEISVYNSVGALSRSFAINIAGGTTIDYYGTAIDRDGSLWVVGSVFFGSSGTWGLAKVPAGASTAAFTTHSGSSNDGGFTNSNAIVMDGAGTAWVANLGPGTVSAFKSDGTPLSPVLVQTANHFPVYISGGYQSGLPNGSLSIAVDTAGNVWVADPGTDTIGELVGAATPVTPLAIGVRDGTVGQLP